MDFILQVQEHITSDTVNQKVLGWVGDNIQAQTGINKDDLNKINSVLD